ncbi:hypothetical protein [Lacrimispora sp. 38-1]|uniref:hypothetical protein n=1 Tax=Lacrimispora sp. 38-1 TaxID=3125778 RepID=UPI003CECBCE2
MERCYAVNPLRGLLFLKTKMADCNIHEYCANSKKHCGDIRVNVYCPTASTICTDISIHQEDEVVDRSNSRSVDREEIKELMVRLVMENIEVLIVRDILEITNNEDDLESITNEILGMGICIYELSTGLFRYNSYEEY